MIRERAISIAIVAYPGALESAVLGLGDLFSVASSTSTAQGGRRLDATALRAVPAERGPEETFDAVVLPPSLSGSRGTESRPLLAWLAAQHASGATMCSVCAGAFWLANAGLLDGRPATTHWALEAEFRTQFRAVRLDAGEMLIDDNDVVTAGGVMAWLDMGLFVVERWLGAGVMSRTARHLLIDTAGREQRTYRSFRPHMQHGDRAIAVLQHWLEANAENTVSVATMAEKAMMSPRTLLRRFRQATGLTPNDYVQNLRVEKARGLLKRTLMPVGEVGWSVGYRDASAFGRVFREATGVSPGEYRNRFGLVRRFERA